MWIARDKDGTLSFFVLKPVRYGDNWIESDSSPNMQDSCTLPKSMFPELTWEDDAMQVDLVPKSKVDLKTLDKLLDDALAKESKESWEAKEKAFIESKGKHMFSDPNERIYYFQDENPSWEEWVKAGIALGYGDSEDDFKYEDYEMLRGDYDYTR